MSPGPPRPITPFAPVDPDADWETIRARVMAWLAERVPASWSDHNAADPGVTFAEAAAFGLADLHYRVAERHYAAWPLEVPAWELDQDRHWYATLPAGSLGQVAEALASPATSASTLEPLVRACASLADAMALLAQAPWSGVFSADQRPAVVSLMRARLVRQVAQEQADVVASAVEAQHRSDDPVAQRDGRAAAELAYVLPLWEEEIRALVRRERRRLSQEALVARLAEVRMAMSYDDPGLRDALANDDLSPAEVDAAMAAGRRPPRLLPEDLEDPAGRTLVWPPHPVQALTCEPVTAADYAARARTHPDVVRSWAVAGRLEGIAWNGLPTGGTPEVVAAAAAALTLVVERRVGAGGAAVEFLRDVLATAVGPEVRAPFPDWRVEVDDLEPRRMICDEVGASLLAQAPVIVQAKLVTAVGVDRDAIVGRVRALLSGFFRAGRRESWLGEVAGDDIDGPWPPTSRPSTGWVPGEPVRFTEVVNAMVADPDLWGVEKLAMKIEGAPTFVPQSAGTLLVPPNAVPVLADARCLQVRYLTTRRCGDA